MNGLQQTSPTLLQKLKTVLANALPRENFSQLPRRIVETIERQDQASEVLARLIQLTVVTTMAVLYLVSPKTDAVSARTRVVPLL